MPTLSACALLAILSPRVSSLGIQFINPPTHGTDGGLSNPPTYKQDYTINIQWYPGDETGPYDLVLHQVKTLGQEQIGDGEFIMRGGFDYFADDIVIVVTGRIVNCSFGISFDVRLKSVRHASTIADPSNPHDQEVHQHMHNDFQLSHKIGLGIAIPATLALGIAAGWLLFRRLQRKRRRVSHQLPATETAQYEPDRDGDRTYNDVHEAPSNHVLEIGQPRGKGFEALGGELEDKPAVVSEVLPLRYEMEANTVHELHDQPAKADEPVVKTED
ncbi:hypothetical protein J4E90_008407 [Alternaria incomplexa]|uniref:uncharacterized protein n=1 Tax=Alternaria incomplexa TaxID=1187928 RepID=UPI00221EF1F0|nr:uncharacterized protein J4E90_008407 [Alternaria incomplexa]KAI4908675.1 hypothetical protein J4E90_008407 [Alternaria incomplexa]